MIVASLEKQNTGQVILQKDHAALALQVAEALGNDDFFAAEPRELMLFLARHHDHGWDEVDSEMTLNPDSGLPYNLVQTPFPDLLRTGPASVDFNEDYHPLCGLLASMHVWGLYNGRYGLSDKIVVDMLPEDKRLQAKDMLDTELLRQEKLKKQLALTKDYAKYLDNELLFRLYKQLQLFDTLSLYFNEIGDSEPTVSEFKNVPGRSGDVSLKLQPVGNNTFVMTPFPFAGTELELTMDSYEVPVELGSQKAFDQGSAKHSTQTFKLVANHGN